MRTSNKAKMLWLSVAMTAMLTLGACADGDLNIEPPVAPEPQLAVIGSFQICKAGAPESCGENLTVEEGASIELVWDTTDATSVEIASADGSFLASPLESSGTLLIEGVTAAMRYTLSAMTADGVAQKDVAVEVASRKVELSASMTPSKERIFEGEQIELCLSVTPEDATVKVTGDDGTVYLESMTAAEAMALPCLKVAPSVTTVYTLVAQSPDGGEATITAQIVVEKKIGVTLSASEVTEDNKVTLSWTVTGPAPDEVKIEPDIGDVKALTDADGKGEKEIEITADTTFTITASVAGQDPVTDSAEVTMPEREIELEISVNDIPVAETTPAEPSGEKLSIAPKAASSAAAAAKQLEINAGTYFANEDVKLSWNASVNGAADKITSVKLLDSAGSVVKDGLLATDSQTITVAGDGQYTLSLSGDGIKEKTAKIAVNVRTWVASAAGESTAKEVSAMIADSADMNTLYAGFRGDMTKGKIPFQKATVSAGGITEEMLEIELRTLLADGQTNQSQFTDKMDTYPLNTIAQDPEKKERLYAGSAGSLLMSDDSGKKWVSVRHFLMVNSGEYAGSHKSCKGETQDGIKGAKLAGYSQVCDIIAMGAADNNRLIVATDREVVYLEYGVDKYMTAKDPAKAKEAGMTDEDRFKYMWAGMPLAGNQGNAVYGVVTHDLELVTFEGGTRQLYAATEKGLFSSSDLGANWTQETSATLGSTELFSVAADVKNMMIYVGGTDGVYYKELKLDAADWQKASVDGVVAAPVEEPVEEAADTAEDTEAGEEETPAPATTGTRVFSITADPVQAGSVYAATESGFLVSRDGGKTFRNVKAEKVLGVVSRVASDGTVGIYAATANGLAASLAKPVTIPAVAPEDSGTPKEETPPAEEQETPAETPAKEDDIVKPSDINGALL